MTTYFAYDELTWPEIDALPRDTPLVIPLGGGIHWIGLPASWETHPAPDCCHPSLMAGQAVDYAFQRLYLAR